MKLVSADQLAKVLTTDVRGTSCSATAKARKLKISSNLRSCPQSRNDRAVWFREGRRIAE